MKESSFMMTLLILDPKSPGKDIDVYLRPLIDDLKDLWVKPGVETIDVAIGLQFNMRAMVLWTINNFPARSSLSGWSGQGYKACPTCNKDTPYVRVDPPKEFSRDEILTQFRHHAYRKNVLEAILNTLLLNDKSKDTAKARLAKVGHSKWLVARLNQKREVLEASGCDDMLKAQIKVVDILCDLELIYPHALFDIMIHLVIHLPLEALKGGPIRPRWMFPFERYMKKLKGYVRNKAKPEGSITEGYVAEEALTFSYHYFWDVTTKFNRPDRNVDPPPPTCQF
ncbi:hypothetical protein Tco_1159448 [Tanacetum coccineum]